MVIMAVVLAENTKQTYLINYHNYLISVKHVQKRKENVNIRF